MVAYLSPLMVRQLKAKIRVPLPIRQTVHLECSASERLAYNSLVSYIHANLVLTSLKGAEHARAPTSPFSITQTSSRRAPPSRTYALRVTAAASRWRASRTNTSRRRGCGCRRGIARRRGGRARDPLHAVRSDGTPLPCDSCELPLLMLLIMPMCGHLVCPECVGGTAGMSS